MLLILAIAGCSNSASREPKDMVNQYNDHQEFLQREEEWRIHKQNQLDMRRQELEMDAVHSLVSRTSASTIQQIPQQQLSGFSPEQYLQLQRQPQIAPGYPPLPPLPSKYGPPAVYLGGPEQDLPPDEQWRRGSSVRNLLDSRYRAPPHADLPTSLGSY